MQLVKSAVHSLFRSFGYHLVKVNSVKQKWVDVDDALAHNSIDKINEFYTDDTLLTSYINEDRISFYQEITELLVEKGIDLNGKNVADVGSGTGHLLFYVNEKFKVAKSTGLEYSPEAIKIAKELFPSIKFFQYDIYQPWNGKFDAILCTEVLEHLLYPEKAMKSLLSMTMPHGYLFLTVPNGRKDTFGGHINFWSPESWDVFIKTSTAGHKSETGTMHDSIVNYAIIYPTNNYVKP